MNPDIKFSIDDEVWFLSYATVRVDQCSHCKRFDLVRHAYPKQGKIQRIYFTDDGDIKYSEYLVWDLENSSEHIISDTELFSSKKEALSVCKQLNK